MLGSVRCPFLGGKEDRSVYGARFGGLGSSPVCPAVRWSIRWMPACGQKPSGPRKWTRNQETTGRTSFPWPCLPIARIAVFIWLWFCLKRKGDAKKKGCLELGWSKPTQLPSHTWLQKRFWPYECEVSLSFLKMNVFYRHYRLPSSSKYLGWEFAEADTLALINWIQSMVFTSLGLIKCLCASVKIPHTKTSF